MNAEKKEIRQELLTGERALFQGKNLKIYDTIFDDGESPLKESRDIELYGSMFKWKYPLWYAQNILAENSFDGAKNLESHNAKMLSKDAFWNSENVTVYDSFISGEYLGWNAKNLTLVNCTIESLQGMCYIENLVMKNCRLLNTTLAFEYSTVDAEIHGKIDSVMNPASGIIRADEIGELIMDQTKVDPAQTKIICSSVKSEKACA